MLSGKEVKYYRSFSHLIASKDPGTKGSGFSGLPRGINCTHAFWLMGSFHLLLQLQCHDEVSFLACRRFSLPGLHLVQFMREQALADVANLVWSCPLHFPFKCAPDFHGNMSRSCQLAPLLSWSKPSPGGTQRVEDPRKEGFFLSIAKALLSVMPTPLNIPGSLWVCRISCDYSG